MSAFEAIPEEELYSQTIMLAASYRQNLKDTFKKEISKL